MIDFKQIFDTRTVVGNLLIINILVFLAQLGLGGMVGGDLADVGGMFYFGSVNFRPFQVFTHFFMHGGFMHLLFNMYAFVIFGTALERVWGPKRFLFYYLATAIGAAIIYQGFVHFEAAHSFNKLLDLNFTKDDISYVLEKMKLGQEITMTEAKPYFNNVFHSINTPVIGASGAVFGVLLGFGMLFPNTELMLMFVPIPIKAKYFVIGYGAIELIQTINNNPGDNVAHVAHLGGMIFGYFLIKFWQKSNNSFY
jgi:membrane associated rhomboid family serine protease